MTSKTKYLTDTDIHNSLRAESKGLVYRELIRAYPRNQSLFTPYEVKAAIVASDGLDPGISGADRGSCSTAQVPDPSHHCHERGWELPVSADLACSRIRRSPAPSPTCA